MYRVQLKNFEGPLDLLLFFIKRDELDIYNIPISYITSQFLDYIRLMEELDLEVASEFILMASMLMSIKAQMMLPNENDGKDEIDETDPRYELVQRLLEYKRYKEMGGKMQMMAQEAGKQFYRGANRADRAEKNVEQASGEALQDVTMFDLMRAFKKVLVDVKKRAAVHRVEKVEATIEKQTMHVMEFLQAHGKSSFRQVCASFQSVTKIIVTFLALLEMLKEQRLALYLENNDPTSFYVDLKSAGEIIQPEPPTQADIAQQ